MVSTDPPRLPTAYRAQFPCWLLAAWWVIPALLGLTLLSQAAGGLTEQLIGIALACGAGWLCWRAVRARTVVSTDGVTVYGFFRTHRLPWASVARVALLEDRVSALPVWTRPLLVLHDGRRISLEMVRSVALSSGQQPGLAFVVGRACSDANAGALDAGLGADQPAAT